MANEEHLSILRQGVAAWDAWREKSRVVRPDLSEANLDWVDLHGVDLRAANLHGAHFNWARLIEADLRGADLRDVDFSWAHLPWADLRGAELAGVNLYEVNLYAAKLAGLNLQGAHLAGARLDEANAIQANLVNADLRRASLVDAHLDRADLTGAKLWGTQRGGWSIKGVVCRRVFWDREGEKPDEYADGEFERAYAERPRIVLRYPGGMSPVDLALLPLIVERLQAAHPGSKLHVRSVQDEGTGASVTITVEDLEGRNAAVFKAEVVTLRGTLVAIQDRLRSEESLRLAFETKYQAVVQDVLPMMLQQALPRREVHIGHITGPTVIEGTAMGKGDTYYIPGQAGAVGPGAQASGNTFQQVQGGLDLPKLAEELAELQAALRQEGTGEPEEDEAIGAVAAAEKAAKQGDEAGVLRHLKVVGAWTLGIAEKVGVPVVVEVIKRALA